MRSKSNTDGDELTNDRKQEGPYKGVETQGKGRQSLIHIPAQDIFLAVLQSDLAFKGRVVLLSRVLYIFVSRVDIQVAASTDESQSTGENLIWRFGKITQEHFITHSLTTKMVLPGAASQSTLYISSTKVFAKLFNQQIIDLWRDGPYWNHLVK